MRTDAYWAGRLETLNESQLNKGEKYIQSMNTQYEKAMSSIQRDIDSFYGRFAINNGVDMATARQMLKAGELKEFKWTVEDYIKRGKENAIDQRWMKELENASIRVRMSRLEALQIQMQQHVEVLAASRQAGAQGLLGGIYKDNYHRSIFELQKGAGIGSSFAKLDSIQLDKLLSTPWAPDGTNFSGRIWADRKKLISELKTALTQNLIRGDSKDQVISEFSKRMGVSRSAAARIIMTESAYISGQSRLDAYKELGVTEYKYMATLDLRTSSICKSMDGKIIPITEAQAGVNYPPLHAHCRSTTIPHFEDNVQERAARGDDGKTYGVPGDITYQEWEKKHLPSEKNGMHGIDELVTSQSIQQPLNNDIIKSSSFRKFSTAEETQAWIDQVTPAWIGQLTIQEAEAIRRYTGNDYLDINKNLRAGGGMKVYDNVAKDISSALSKFNLLENIVVYRGLERNIFNMPVEQMPGLIIEEAAFVSTTLLSDRAFSGTVRLELRVPAKSTGAAVVPLSEFEGEYEFLLDKKTKYQIVEASEMAGILIIIAEVLPK
ncbi:hypothetical protein Back11_11630 [Paenibacillus baekrokdamisoli]|uniref:Uncharacterized protein n=1 Tax=Paenibacillus baekrokdamisoli TaxID=1712516 RepID=A0A3G9J7M8_9BACL|nr:ADP-ribosyltransferase [Paenibacillus baekrokdamisoli]MBB3070467.1 SPP1 gp7 family putative phage head morphogenesis protein [Paenibacillus baekrokdamisoli]BBH19818.1 hypothetical protein Back11_11630 [Paenibacillus baekrokdamisoli]